METSTVKFGTWLLSDLSLILSNSESGRYALANSVKVNCCAFIDIHFLDDAKFQGLLWYICSMVTFHLTKVIYSLEVVDLVGVRFIDLKLGRPIFFKQMKSLFSLGLSLIGRCFLNMLPLISKT